MGKLRIRAVKGFRCVCVVVFLVLLTFFASGCQNKSLTKDDFLLNVTHGDIKPGEAAAFHCELTIPEWVKIEHGAQMICYAVDGKSETITSQKIIEHFSKGQTIERTVSLTFAEKGDHTITFYSEFEVVSGDESTKYLIEKEIPIHIP